MKAHPKPHDLRRVALDLLSAWAVAAEGKTHATKKRLAEVSLELWAAAAEGSTTERPD